MLEHFKAGYDVERGWHFVGELLHRYLLVLHSDTALKRMQFSDIERGFSHINAGYVCAALRHGFTEDAAAAADVEYFFTSERCVTVNVIGSQRVNVVERFELTFSVPPT